MKRVQRPNSELKKRGLLTSRREEIIEHQYDEIKRLEAQYRQLYEGSIVMLRTINTSGMILNCNQAYQAGLSFSNKNEVIGHSIFEHTPSDKIQALRASFEEWLQTGIVTNKEVWLKRKDGSTFPALINANNLCDDKGNLIGSNSVITDMTEIYRTRKLQESAIENIRKASEMREEFLRIAAHELRTPIQPILLAAENALDNEENSSSFAYQQKAWKTVLRQAMRLKQLADDVLDVSRIDSGNLSYNKKMLRINEILIESSENAKLVLDSHSHQHHHSNKSIVIDLRLDSSNDKNFDIELFLDRNRIEQALANILSNALKFTEEGKITVETTIFAQKRLFEIKISDTGPGIAEEILPNLFGKFVTKTAGKTSDKHGTGLGLFITKAIIQAHAGDIFAYNNEGGKGATFVIRLPIPSEKLIS